MTTKNYHNNTTNILAAIELEEALNQLMKRYVSVKPGNSSGTVIISTSALVDLTNALESYHACDVSREYLL